MIHRNYSGPDLAQAAATTGATRTTIRQRGAGDGVVDVQIQGLERLKRETSNMKVALVHDYLNQYGGAERVLEALHDIFPQSPVFTSIYAPKLMPDHMRGW